MISRDGDMRGMPSFLIFRNYLQFESVVYNLAEFRVLPDLARQKVTGANVLSILIATPELGRSYIRLTAPCCESGGPCGSFGKPTYFNHPAYLMCRFFFHDCSFIWCPIAISANRSASISCGLFRYVSKRNSELNKLAPGVVVRPQCPMK